MLDNSHSDHSDLVKKYQESTLPEKIPENRPEGKAMAERVHTRTNFTIKGCSVNNELSQVTQLYDCSPESISIPPAQAELEDALINIPKLAVKAGLPRETATLRTPSPHLHMNYKMNNKIKTHNIGPYQNYQSDGFSKSQQVRKGQSVVLEKDPRTEICSRKFKKINQRARPHHGDPFQGNHCLSIFLLGQSYLFFF